jgi:hypothetical protein
VIAEVDPQLADAAQLHDFIDSIQVDLGAIHEQIALTWFLPDEAA